MPPQSHESNCHLIGWYNRYATKAHPMPLDDNLHINLCEELHELSLSEHHDDCIGHGNKMTKCPCLQVFCNATICLVTANALLSKMQLPKQIQDEFFIQEARYVLQQGNEHNKRQFVIPYSNSAKGAKDTLTGLTHEHLQFLNSHKIVYQWHSSCHAKWSILGGH